MTAEGAIANKSKVIIGVDDTPENLVLLGHVVAAAGYTFLAASSGAECLTLLSRVEPRLILLDVQMPEMDGYETCRKIRADVRLRQVPVAFLTSRKTTEDVRAGIAAGGNDFILKPFENAQLINRLNHWTRQRVNRA
jgi:CheY-like chemotaxis protein